MAGTVGAWQLNFLCGARFDFCALPKLMLQEEEEQQQWLQQIAAGCQKSYCCRLLRLRFKSHGSASRNVINWLLIATAGQSQWPAKAGTNFHAIAHTHTHREREIDRDGDGESPKIAIDNRSHVHNVRIIFNASVH